jgi:hypothetical protein
MVQQDSNVMAFMDVLTHSAILRRRAAGNLPSAIEICSPHYSTLRDGNQTTIPEDYLPKGYTAPGFRINAKPD